MATETFSEQTETSRDTEPRSDSLPALLKELRHETNTLVRQEVLLAKTEVSETLERVARNLGYLAVGGLVAVVGVVFLFVALNEGLERLLVEAGLPQVAPWLSPLIIGVVIGAIGLGLVTKALGTLKKESLVPQQTVDSLKEDKEWIKQKAK